MIRGLIRFSAHNRFIVLLMTAVAVAYGIWVVTNSPVDAIPDLSDTQVICSGCANFSILYVPFFALAYVNSRGIPRLFRALTGRRQREAASFPIRR